MMASGFAGRGTRGQRRNRSLVRHAVALGLVLLVAAIASPLGTTTNEDHLVGKEAVARLDQGFRDIAAGHVTVGKAASEVDAGVVGLVVPTQFGDVVVLVTPTPHDCYALWWDDARARHGRIMADDLACEPGPLAISQRPVHFKRAGVEIADPAAPYPWDLVLPPSERLRYFVLPGAILGTGLVLSILVRMSIVLITGEPVGRSRHP